MIKFLTIDLYFQNWIGGSTRTLGANQISSKRRTDILCREVRLLLPHQHRLDHSHGQWPWFRRFPASLSRYARRPKRQYLEQHFDSEQYGLQPRRLLLQAYFGRGLPRRVTYAVLPQQWYYLGGYGLGLDQSARYLYHSSAWTDQSLLRSDGHSCPDLCSVWRHPLH